MGIPKILRILVIDDKVAANIAWMEQIRNTFFTWAKKANSGLDWVDVVFAGTPGDGARIWQEETFDFTLIDSHFEQKNQSGDHFTQYALELNSQYQGLFVNHLFKALTRNDSNFDYRDSDSFLVWSSFSKKQLEHIDDLKPRILLNKMDGINFLKEKIEDIADSYISAKEEITLERAITFAKICNNCINSPKNSNRLLWPDHITDSIRYSYIVYDKNNSFPYLPKICGDINWRVGGKRIPTKITGRNKWMPMIPETLKSPLWQLISYMVPKRSSKQLTNPGVHSQEIKKQKLKIRKATKDKIVNYLAYKRQPFTHKYEPPSEGTFDFLGYHFKNKYIAAATPLTGTSVVGLDTAITLLKNKVIDLLNGPFSGVILKTCYLDKLDQWKDVHWPALQIQSHMRQRCLYPNTGTPTLWNTGRTALEMLMPKDLNELLKRLQKDLEDDTHRVIVSLGSKFHRAGELKRGFRRTVSAEFKNIWDKLFEKVFENLNENLFPLVEINVRHFLREIVKYYLGGDEYLNPTYLDEKCSFDFKAFWDEYSLWLSSLQEVAIKYRKKLILKMPYRSDTLALIRYAVSLRRLHIIQESKDDPERIFGIRAFTIVNALKTPVPKGDFKGLLEHTPAYYADPRAWKDAGEKMGKYQMSGAWVAPYNTQITKGLLENNSTFEKLGLGVMMSGGLTSEMMINSIEELFKKTKVQKMFQVGTWGLLNTDISKNSWKLQSDPPNPAWETHSSLIKSECSGSCGDNCSIKEILKELPFLERDFESKIKVIPDFGKVSYHLIKRVNDTCLYHKFFISGSGSESIEREAVKNGNKEIELNRIVLNCRGCANCPVEKHFDSLTILEKNLDKGVKLNDKERNISREKIDEANKYCNFKNLLTIKELSITEEEEKSSQIQIIKPRIAFLSRQKCQACGTCVRTYYCDAFSPLDRRTGGIIPYIEPRYCSGCGLCAQVCPHNAIRLFDPRDFIILLDDSDERHEILLEQDIPHVHLKKEALNGFSSLSGKKDAIKSILEDPDNNSIDEDELLEILKSIYTDRVPLDEFCLNRKGKDDTYSDDRPIALGWEDQFLGKKLIDAIQTENNRKLKSAFTTAAIWAMLIWTDPGQVFWESPIIKIRTEFIDADNNQPMVSTKPTDSEEVKTALDKLKESNQLFTRNYIIVLNGDNLNNSENSDDRLLSKTALQKSVEDSVKFKVNNKVFNEKSYQESGLGVNRLCGFDIRGAGEYLVDEFDKLSLDEINAIAGFPKKLMKAILRSQA